MATETVVFLVLVAVIVAAIALYVIAIGLSLRKLSRTLGAILGGLQGIRDQTAPAGDVLGGIVADVSGIEQDLDEALDAVADLIGTAPPKATSMHDAVARAREASPDGPPAEPRGNQTRRPAASRRDQPTGAGGSSMREAVDRASAKVDVKR